MHFHIHGFPLFVGLVFVLSCAIMLVAGSMMAPMGISKITTAPVAVARNVAVQLRPVRMD